MRLVPSATRHSVKASCRCCNCSSNWARTAGCSAITFGAAESFASSAASRLRSSFSAVDFGPSTAGSPRPLAIASTSRSISRSSSPRRRSLRDRVVLRSSRAAFVPRGTSSHIQRLPSDAAAPISIPKGPRSRSWRDNTSSAQGTCRFQLLLNIGTRSDRTCPCHCSTFPRRNIRNAGGLKANDVNVADRRQVGGSLLLTSLCLLKEFGRNNGKTWNVAYMPFCFRIHSRNTPARVRVFQHFDAVPDQPTCI